MRTNNFYLFCIVVVLVFSKSVFSQDTIPDSLLIEIPDTNFHSSSRTSSRDLPSSEEFYIESRSLTWEVLFYSINSATSSVALNVLINSSYSEPGFNWYEKEDEDVKIRTMTGDIIFGENSDYNLLDQLGSRWDEYQNHYNKIMSIKTTQDDGDKNSIRVGYRYNIEDVDNYVIDGFAKQKDKFELGFYAHRDHLQSSIGLGDQVPGREFVSLQEWATQFEPKNFELMLSRKAQYVRVGETGVQIHRNIDDWDDEGEKTKLYIESYYGDGNLDKDFWRNISGEDMEFKAENLVADDGCYLDKKLYNKAPKMFLMNSIFYPLDDKEYHGYDQLVAPIKCESDSNNSRSVVNDYWDNDQRRFCVLEPYSNVEFKSEKSIVLRQGFFAKNGCHFKSEIITGRDGCSSTGSSSSSRIRKIQDEVVDSAPPDVSENDSGVPNVRKEIVQINVYPVPFTRTITVEQTAAGHEFEVAVYNSEGMVVYSGVLLSLKEEIHLIDLPSGTYHLCLRDRLTGKSSCHEIVKK